jgi:hydroxyethylthiazole kinase-like uncharacterized protein yjeF
MSTSPWLEPLLDAAAMRATDAWAIGDRGVPARDLMERAGGALARATAETVPTGPVAIVCGKGNNGGDGLVAARLLRQAGRDVDVLLTAPVGTLSQEAADQLRRLPGEPPVEFDAGRLVRAAGIVDALLGTGFEGAPRDPLDTAIRAINGAGLPVVAADVPSGVNGSSGEVAGVAVAATTTIAFHAGKPGLWIAPGKWHAGRVVVAGIGIPPGAPAEPRAGLILDSVLDALPHRGPRSTKFTSGAVLVVGGSRGLTGAPAMAAMAAQRAGAGYVTAAGPASLEPAFAGRLLEVMFAPLSEHDGDLAPDAAEAALARLRRVSAGVLGPGLGREAGAQAMARRLAADADLPLVIDADGLNALGPEFDHVLSARRAPTVLTPHAGELGRLLEVPSSEVDARRLHHASEAARRSNALVVLKGDDTLVVSPDGRVSISAGDAPGLATAGTGDVLAGVIAGLLARGARTDVAVVAGVHAHVRAGRLAALPHGADTVIASDVIAALPAALAG